MSIQAKDEKKNISKNKKKNRKVISLPKVPFKSTIKIKPSKEGYIFAHLKGNKNNADKHHFNTVFVIAYIIKHRNESYIEDNNNNGLQFT